MSEYEEYPAFPDNEDDLRAGPPMMRISEDSASNEPHTRRLCFKCAMVYPMPFRHDLEYTVGGRV